VDDVVTRLNPTTAREIADAESAFARAAAGAGDDALRAASDFISTMRGATRDPAVYVQSIRDAKTLLDSQATSLVARNAKNDASAAASLGGAGAATPDVLTRLKTTISSGLTLSTIIAGVAISGYITAILIRWGQTNGMRINISGITKVDANTVEIQYSPNTQMEGFKLRVGDSIDFAGGSANLTTPALGSGVKVKKIISDSRCQVEAAITSVATNTPGTQVNYGYGTVSSSFETQFIGAVADATHAAAGAAGAALGEGLNALVPPIAGAGEKVFCDIVPFLCQTWIWWAIGGIFVAFIFLFFFLKIIRR
jgi:hypothetical protein